MRLPDNSILEEFPGLSAEELEAVNNFYDHYLFYQKDGHGRRVWTSCCHHQNEYIGPDMMLVTPEHRAVLWAKHGDPIACPFCGRPVEVKSIGTSRRCAKLGRYIPVVFLHASEDGDSIYAQAYWTHKDFSGNYAAEPLYMPTRVYRFRRGEALQWEREDIRGGWEMRPKKARHIQQPFDRNTDNPGYRVVGMERLQGSFLRYTQYESWDLRGMNDNRLHTSLVRYLALAALYPESVEMLMKAKLKEPIEDYIYCHRKNCAVLRWGERDPRRAFGLTRVELREFLGGSRSLETLYVYRAFARAGVKVSMGEAAASAARLFAYRAKPRDVAKVCAAAGVKPEKLVRYLGQYTGGCHAGGHRSLVEIVGHWWDYIGNAKTLGYDMAAPGVLMPRDLQEAHDNAAALIQRQEEERRARELAERNAEEREKLRLAKLTFDRRLAKLRDKYEFQAGGYLIRVAESAEEIIAEGKALGHCVAGYAERHLKGTLTILFLRRANEPDKPLVTMEMDGKRLVQAHGYKNEWKPCPENPNRRSPRALYAEILDPWLAWVKAGSKRDKRGRTKAKRGDAREQVGKTRSGTNGPEVPAGPQDGLCSRRDLDTVAEGVERDKLPKTKKEVQVA